MKTEIKELPKSLLEIKIELSIEEFEPYLKDAASKISEEVKFEGFRPGKVPYEIVKRKVSEATIYESALEGNARKILAKIFEEKDIYPVGQPEFNILKLAPGNPVSFKVIIPVLPKVEKLADLDSIKVEKKKTAVKESDVDKVVGDLQKMRTEEKEADKPADKEDKIVVDMHILKDNVMIEGGDAHDYAVYLNEEHYIPGFNEKLIGMKKDETREFKLKFPKEHYQKNLAGEEMDFKVTGKSVWKLTLPELNDGFAEKMGQKTMEDLRVLIRKNLQNEADFKEEQREEIEMLEALVEKTKFDDIPEVMINQETDRMIQELKEGVARQGAGFDDYLKNIKKGIADLKLDFSAQAVKRIKTSLVIREVAKAENIKVDDKEILSEVEKEMNAAKDNPEAQKHIRSEEYADYARAVLINRKTIEFLKGKIIK